MCVRHHLQQTLLGVILPMSFIILSRILLITVSFIGFVQADLEGSLWGHEWNWRETRKKKSQHRYALFRPLGYATRPQFCLTSARALNRCPSQLCPAQRCLSTRFQDPQVKGCPQGRKQRSQALTSSREVRRSSQEQPPALTAIITSEMRNAARVTEPLA